MNKTLKWLGYGILVFVAFYLLYGFAFNKGKSSSQSAVNVAPAATTVQACDNSNLLQAIVCEFGKLNGFMASMDASLKNMAVDVKGIKSNTDNLVPVLNSGLEDNAQATREVAGTVAAVCTGNCGKTPTYTAPSYTAPVAKPAPQPAPQVVQAAPITVTQEQTVIVNGEKVTNDGEGDVEIELAAKRRCSSSSIKPGTSVCCGTTAYKVWERNPATGCYGWRYDTCGDAYVCSRGKCIRKCIPHYAEQCAYDGRNQILSKDSCGNWETITRVCASNEVCENTSSRTAECVPVVPTCQQTNTCWGWDDYEEEDDCPDGDCYGDDIDVPDDDEDYYYD